jgi:predicted transcriptional regulator
MNYTIEMTKTEAKAAGRLNSETYEELKKYQAAYPTFTISVIEIKKRKVQYKGLDYKYIENYIQKSNRNDKNEILAEFNILRGSDNKNRAQCEKSEVASYSEVKAWFLKKFPEIKEFKKNQSEKIEAILNAA